jgi:hypothetical protein
MLKGKGAHKGVMKISRIFYAELLLGIAKTMHNHARSRPRGVRVRNEA